jgi:hypothetical protein
VREHRVEVHEPDLRRDDVRVERARDRKDPSIKVRVL